jgi:putative tryptophan/tyrosine transport system substrate-binding protein
MKRREFIAGLGSAAAWPVVALAQQPAMPVIGFIDLSSAEASAGAVANFREGLSETGFVEGRNVAIEFRHAQNKIDRLPELAADLVRRLVAVFAALNGQAARAARAADPTIPMVFHTGIDPVATGLISNLNRPGGNVTAVSSMDIGLMGKQLGLLHEVLPHAERFGALVGSGVLKSEPVAELKAAAAVLGWQLEVRGVDSDLEIDSAFASLMQKRAEALIIGAGPLFRDRRAQIVSLAAHYGVPAISTYRLDAVAGGLMSCGQSQTGSVTRIMGTYAGRILKGEKAGDLPVQRATRFDFVINLQTAKTLGLTVPPALLALADDVIE